MLVKATEIIYYPVNVPHLEEAKCPKRTFRVANRTETNNIKLNRTMENTPNQDLEKLVDLIKDIKTAMFTTAETDGTLRSRPMRTQEVKSDGYLWFFNAEDSAKTYEIQQDRRVNVSYMDDAKNTYVSVSGRARNVKDKAKIDELWHEPLKAWFPEGKDDPNISLIKVTIDQAEYWDAPSSTLVHLYGMVKATVTGEPAHPGENKKINL